MIFPCLFRFFSNSMIFPDMELFGVFSRFSLISRAQGQGNSDQKMVCYIPPSQDAFTHQIWNSYLQEYTRYAPDSMQFLETRLEVEVNATVTQGWFAILCHPKMHFNTKFGIPTSHNI